MNKIVVLIDDDPDDLDVMRESIHSVDPSVSCFSFIYADEAIQLLSRELVLLPDFIFIDINMPKKNGIQCLQELRKLEHLKQTSIVMNSTSMTEMTAHMLLREGATKTFQKPFRVDDYITILTPILHIQERE